jgi:hypothetical protein
MTKRSCRDAYLRVKYFPENRGFFSLSNTKSDGEEVAKAKNFVFHKMEKMENLKINFVISLLKASCFFVHCLSSRPFTNAGRIFSWYVCTFPSYT